MSDANSGWQDGSLHELVILTGMNELDNLWCLVVHVCFVICIDVDLALRELKATYIDTSSTSILLQEIDKSGQIVSQIFGFLERSKELSLVIFFLFLGFELVLTLALLNVLSLSETLLFVANKLQLLFSLKS